MLFFAEKKVKIVPVRDGQTGKGAGKLLKPVFGPWAVPLTHCLCVREETTALKKKEKNEQQQRNNKKCLRACLCMCMPFSGYKISPWLWHYRPLLPWLLENSTYTTQSICEHPPA